MKRHLVFVVLVAALGINCGGGSDNSVPSDAYLHTTISAINGGTLEASNGTRLIVPPEAIAGDTVMGFMLDSEIEAPSGATPVGPLQKIDLGAFALEKPVRLELPYDPSKLPDGVAEDEIFISYFDEDAGVWTAVGGFVDVSRHVVTVETTHASTWGPWTWIADAVIQGIVTGFKFDFAGVVDAFAAFDGCLETDGSVVIDESDANDYLGSCVEVDDLNRPRIRVVNRRTFAISLESVGVIPATLSSSQISRLKTSTFEADFSNPGPNDSVTIRATVNWDATLEDIILDVLELLPLVNVTNSTVQLVALIDDAERCTAAANALANGGGAFSSEFGACLAEIAPEIAAVLGVAPKGLFAVLAGISGIGGIAIQLEDGAASARRGPGQVRYFSTKIPVVVNTTPAASPIPTAAETPTSTKEFRFTMIAAEPCGGLGVLRTCTLGVPYTQSLQVCVNRWHDDRVLACGMTDAGGHATLTFTAPARETAYGPGPDDLDFHVRSPRNVMQDGDRAYDGWFPEAIVDINCYISPSRINNGEPIDGVDNIYCLELSDYPGGLPEPYR